MIDEKTREDERLSVAATQGFLRAAEGLGLKGAGLARATGLSEPTISRLRKGACHLTRGTKSYELAMLLVRLHLALGKVFRGQPDGIREWMKGHQKELQGVPADKIEDIRGLVTLLTYAELRAARA